MKHSKEIHVKCKWAHIQYLIETLSGRIPAKDRVAVETQQRHIFFSCLMKSSVCVGSVCSFTVAEHVVFLITLPPRRNKQLIRQNQGLWLVINDCFKGLFSFAVCLFVFLAHFSLWWKDNSDSDVDSQQRKSSRTLFLSSRPSNPSWADSNVSVSLLHSLWHSHILVQTLYRLYRALFVDF